VVGGEISRSDIEWYSDVSDGEMLISYIDLAEEGRWGALVGCAVAG
jgi:hypothetical protein